MTDFSTPYLALQRSIKEFHDATLKGEYQRAYEISMDITDLSQQLEDIAKGLANAFTD